LSVLNVNAKDTSAKWKRVSSHNFFFLAKAFCFAIPKIPLSVTVTSIWIFEIDLIGLYLNKMH